MTGKPQAAPVPFTLDELGNTYVGPKDRFVVSLLVGYGEDEGVATAAEAGHAALQLTRDEGSPDTHWYIHDRQTGVTTLYEQHELENPDDKEDAEEPELCSCGRESNHCASQHGADYCADADEYFKRGGPATWWGERFPEEEAPQS